MKILNNWEKFNEELNQSTELWEHIITSPEKIKKYLDKGGDPNYDNGSPLRMCCRGTWKNGGDIGEGYFESFKVLIDNGAKLEIEGRPIVVKWCAEYGRIDFIEYLIDNAGLESGFKMALSWLEHSRKISGKKKEDTINYLTKKITEFEGGLGVSNNIDKPKVVDNIDMSNPTNIWTSIISNPRKVKKYLDEGGDPNNGNGFPMRLCVRGTWKNAGDIGQGYFDSFKLLVENGGDIDVTPGRSQVIKWCAEYGRVDFIEYLMNERGVKNGFAQAYEWLKNSRKIAEKEKAEILDYLEDKSYKFGEEIHKKPVKPAGYNAPDTQTWDNYNTKKYKGKKI